MIRPPIALRCPRLLLLLAAAFAQPAIATAQTAPEQEVTTTLPRPISQSPIAYPTGARGAALVILQITVMKDGTTQNILVRQGEEPFASAAAEGVRNWKFSPASRGGVAMNSRVLVQIDFGDPEAASGKSENDSEGMTAEAEADENIAVVVMGQRAEIGTTFIPIEDARKVPGAFTDPFRAAAIRPGVAPILSGLPYFFVRGAPPGNVGYFLDGIRVPFLFHVGAGPSVVAPALVGSVDLFPSAYPAEMGRYAGAILSGTTQPLAPAARGEVLLRTFDSSALIEQPLGDATVLAAGRKSYLQPLLDRVAPDYEANYWDYQTRLGYQLNSRDSVSIFAFGAADFLRDKTQEVTLFDAEFHRLDLRWSHNGEAGLTQIALGLGQDRILVNANPDDIRAEGDIGYSSLRSRGINLRAQTELKLTGSLRLRAGLNYRADQFEEPFVSEEPLTSPSAKRTDLSTATYFDLVIQPVRGLEVVPGLRLETGLWQDAGYLYPEPRLASRVHLASGVTWTSSLGIVHQLPSATIRGPGVLPSKLSNSVQESYQLAETLEFSLPAGLIGHVTGFYSHTLARAADLAARNFGAEFFLRRDFGERVGFVLSYTLSRSDDTNELGERRISEFDRTHLASASLGINLGAGIRFGARGYLASGGTYVAPCPLGDCTDDSETFELAGRLPTFLRADVRIDKKWELDSGAWITIAAEWFNASRSEESYDARWNAETSSVEYVTQAPITVPSINLEAGF